MTIDEAIKHCEEVAEHNEALIKRGYAGGCNSHDCSERAENHRQLADWLRELKELSRQMGDYKRLLKLAVEDIHELLVERKDISIRNTGRGCMVCNYAANCNCCEICTVANELKNWRHADEALKLMGDNTNE